MKKFFIIIVFAVLFSCDKKMPEDLESTRREIGIRVEQMDAMTIEELNVLKTDLTNYTEDANRRGFSKDNSELVNEISSRIKKLEDDNIENKSSSHLSDSELQSIEAYTNGYNDGQLGYGLSPSETATATESYMAHGYNYSRPDVQVYLMGYSDGIGGRPKRY